MVFCGSCGKQAGPNDRFCTGCGTAIESAGAQVKKPEPAEQETLDAALPSQDSVRPKDEDSDPEQDSKPGSAPTTKLLGKKLEDKVEEIYTADGYATKTRQKLKGRSGSYNEIDVLATRNGTRLAIECKNYSKSNKVGIKDMRDFLGKLEDLNMKSGVFITSSYFSEEAMNLARHNPQGKMIEMWNYGDLTRRTMSLSLGRNEGSKQYGTFRIENALPLNTSVADQSILHLTNRGRVTIRKCELTFYPICVVSYSLRDKYRAPNKKMYTIDDEGAYFADGVSGSIIRDNAATEVGKHMVADIREFGSKTVEIAEDPDCKIIRHDPGFDRKDLEFKVKNSVAKKNTGNVEYMVKVGRNRYDTRKYIHIPRASLVKCNTRVVSVPTLDIEFVSGERAYGRTVMMTSGIVVRDDISVCKHRIGKKTTVAVCDVCGVAKCGKCIILGHGEDFYCKDHAPEELKPESRRSAISKKLKKFGIRRKRVR